jgi:hypothetical protein
MRFEDDRLADLALCVRHPLCLRPDPIDRPGVGTSLREGFQSLATAQEIGIEVNPWQVDLLARQRKIWVEKPRSTHSRQPTTPRRWPRRPRSAATLSRPSQN